MSEYLGAADEPLLIAEEVDEQSASFAKQQKLPQPGLPLSLLLAFVPQVLQVMVGVAVMIVTMMIYVAVTNRPDQLESFIDEHQVYLFPVGTFTTLLGALAVAKIIYWRDTRRCIGMRSFSVVQGIAMMMFLLPLAILASELTNVLAMVMSWFEPAWLTDLRRTGSETFREFAELWFALVLVAGCILPGVGEEILCRGVMGRGLVARHGMVMGVFWTSLLFGIMHIEPVHAFGAFALGIGLHFVFLTTQSLVAAMVVHALNNAVAFLLMRYRDVFPLPGLSTSPEEGAHTPPLVVLASVLSLVASGWLLYQVRTRWRLPSGESWSPGYLSAETPPEGVPAAAEQEGPTLTTVMAATVATGLLIAALVVAYR